MYRTAAENEREGKIESESEKEKESKMIKAQKSKATEMMQQQNPKKGPIVWIKIKIKNMKTPERPVALLESCICYFQDRS